MLCLVCRWNVSNNSRIQRCSFDLYSGEVASAKLLQRISTLLNASLAESSKGTYKRAWSVFNEFSVSVFGKIVHPALTVSIIALFVAHLHSLNLSYKTINTHLSAIAYMHKMLTLPNPTSHFLITCLIRGAQNLSPSYDFRLPITIHILDRLVSSLEQVAQSFFHRILFTVMFLFAFNTFARVGEITLSSDKSLKFKKISQNRRCSNYLFGRGSIQDFHYFQKL